MEGERMKGMEFFSDLSSEPRLEILQLLQETPLKPSHVAKKMSFSIQAVTRHLDKLAESMLIEKNEEGAFQLSSIAKIVLHQIPFFEFLSKNKEYFTTHDFTGIPDHLISRIGDLANCRFEPDFMKSIQTAKEFCIDAKKFIYSATCTMPMEIFDIFLEKNSDFQWRNAYGTNTIVAKGFYNHPAREKCFKKFVPKNFEEKIIQKIPIIVAVSENGCQLLFANKKTGQVDGAGGAFFGKDEKSIKWCKELVDHYWGMTPIQGFTLREQ